MFLMLISCNKGIYIFTITKIQSIARILGPLTTIFIQTNKSIQTIQKVPQTQAKLGFFW